MDKSSISNNLLYSQKHSALLVNLNKISFKNSCPLKDILDLITESIVEGLDIDRASFWKIEAEKLVCINLFDRNENAHIAQNDLSSRDFPIYFKALSDGIAIVADDAKTNYYTKEFTDSYLIPNGITDMLDLPIRENGKVIGVLCCEHKNQRRTWNASDFAFARSIADNLTLLLEQNKNNIIQEKLIESERKLSLITQNSTDGFVVIESGMVTFASKNYINFIGIYEDEMKNFSATKIFEYIHNDDKDAIYQSVYYNLKNKSTNFKHEFRLRLKNGLYSWREDNVAVVYDQNGR